MYFKVVSFPPFWPEAQKDFSFIFKMRTMGLPQVKLRRMRDVGVGLEEHWAFSEFLIFQLVCHEPAAAQ